MDATKIPVAPEGEKVSAHDVRSLDHGVEEYLGPVIVGGCYSTDCFADADANSIGTGVKTYKSQNDHDGDENGSY